jgi:hypothetical protein
MTVVLSLSHHCIETAARREHRRISGLMLEGQAPEGAEADLVLLAEFLGQTDFRRLRAERPELCGGRPVSVELRRDGSRLDLWVITSDGERSH